MLRIGLALIWLLFTVALATWQFFYSVKSVSERLIGDPDFDKHLKMIRYENYTLITCLFLGGTSLIYLLLQEEKRRKEITLFFATFSHELKTSLANLKLQTEGILDLPGDQKMKQVAGRLSEDLNKLDLQLENSLFLARSDSEHFYIESIAISKIISQIRLQFDIQINLKSDAEVLGDIRALESIFKNIIANAITHGKATLLNIEVIKGSPVEITFTDDGIGFTGNPKSLGKLFARPASSSKNGIGIYLMNTLIEKMSGQFKIQPSNQGSGFSIRMTLPAGQTVIQSQRTHV